MPYYDLCFINRQLGYFERTERFDALNDEVAAGIADRLKGPQPAELWCGGRLIRRFADSRPLEIPADGALSVAAA